MAQLQMMDYKNKNAFNMKGQIADSVSLNTQLNNSRKKENTARLLPSQ